MTKGKAKAKGKSENQVMKGKSDRKRFSTTSVFIFAFCLFPWFSLVWADKTAEDFYHGSAYKYIAGRHQEAAAEVEEGLREFPKDEPLQNLASLLKQMKDQQRQDQNQGGGGESQDEKDSKPDKNEEDAKNKDKKDSEQKKDKGQEDEKKPEEQAEDSGKKPDSTDRADSSAAEQQKPKPGQMSKEEAERLLNSFADEEKKEQRDRGRSGKRVDVEQDW